MNASSLQNLHDIIVPQPVAWFPPASGWYALSFSLFLLGSWFLVKKYLLWKRNKYRREALLELSELKNRLADRGMYGQLLPQIPRLVKRTAIVAYGRNMVASLSGDDWLNFLDITGSTKLFSKEGGQLLTDCSYQSVAKLDQFTSKQVTDLHKAVLHWIRKHQTSFPLTGHTSI